MNRIILTIATLLSSLWLATSVKAENPEHIKQMRETRRCPGCDLSGANLTGTKLVNADLSGANLKGADLSGADLRGVILEGANLNGANLKEAILVGANLRSSNLEGANLSGANLSNADLRNANLIAVELKDTILKGVIGLPTENSSTANPETSRSQDSATTPVRAIHYKPPEGAPIPRTPGGSR